MKVVILAGGKGTRISEESHLRPKPMIEIGGKPILWHIMKHYSHHGLNEFIICAGYKGYVIKEYFANYFLHNSDITFDLKNNTTEIHQNKTEAWKVTIVDTGEETLTGGRLKRVQKYLGQDDFCMTYGDGLSDVNIPQLLEHHRNSGCWATVTATLPPGRFGSLDLKDGRVTRFVEKPEGDAGYINGGFFVLSPKALEFVDGDQTSWERAPMERLAENNQLNAYVHSGFWMPMDSLRDRLALQDMWDKGRAPWKVW